MKDPVRDWIFRRWGVDDPASARELPAPRLRFTLADGPEPLAEAERRALALLGALRGPVQARWVAWEPDARLEGAVWEAAPTAEGAPRWVTTTHAVCAAAWLGPALRGDQALDLWALDADEVLYRPYDDRGADLLAPEAAHLDRFALSFKAWLLEDRR